MNVQCACHVSVDFSMIVYSILLEQTDRVVTFVLDQSRVQVGLGLTRSVRASVHSEARLEQSALLLCGSKA